MPATKRFTLIQNDDEFSELCTNLGGLEFLAIDTEFVRESTYYPRFCLLQIASTLGIFCIDPLSVGSLAPLAKLLDQSASCFVLHSARQDLEVLLQNTDRLPVNMLDTQIAAGLAGYHEQIGYATLVDELTQTKLSKEQTRTDWSQRPLTKEQLNYAADDVIYLDQIFSAVSEKLDAMGRSEWWKEDSSALLCTKFYDPPNADAWKKVRGLLDLDPQALARALIIAEWREDAAQSLDIPRTWVLRDEALLHWAGAAEVPLQTLRMRNIARHAQQEKAEDLERRLAQEAPVDLALRLSQASKGKIDPSRKNLIKRLSEKNQLCANELGISASVLATRKDLETLIDQPERCRLTNGWRKSVIGEDLQTMVASG